MITQAVASINRQKDTSFIHDINIHIEKIHTILDKELSNDIVELRSSYDKIEKYAKKIKKSMLEKELRNISKILSHRFNFTITVQNLSMKDFKLSSIIMPNLNYKTLNIALEDIDSLFPKKQFSETLWNTTASISETSIYKTLNNITNSIREEKISIDLNKAKVHGLYNSNFIINIDFLKTIVLQTEPEDVTALIMYEIGRIFTYIEYMTTTTNNTLTLLDTFIYERFNNNKDVVESLTISMEKTNPNYTVKHNSIRILEEIDTYIINTFNIRNDKSSILKDFKRGGDIFATRFGLGDSLAKLLALRATDGVIAVSGDDITTNAMIDIIIEMMAILLFILTMIFLLVVGLLFAIVYFLYKIVKYILSFILKSILNVFSTLFGVNDNAVGYDVVLIRLDKIKLELIRELRTLELDKESKNIISEQVDYVKDVIKGIKSNVDSLNKYGYIPNSLDEELKLDDIIESLEESEVHLYGVKFENM